jgi:hypothetical protein
MMSATDGFCVRKNGVATMCLNRTRRVAGSLGIAAALLLGGCADLTGPSTTVTASDPARITRTGFLSDYGRLTLAPGGDGALCWRKPELDLKRYNKVLINRILVTIKSDQQEGIDPTDLKSLVDYFHGALVKELKPQMQIVNEPGPGVIVLRIALTDLVPTQVSRSVVGTAIPYGLRRPRQVPGWRPADRRGPHRISARPVSKCSFSTAPAASCWLNAPTRRSGGSMLPMSTQARPGLPIPGSRAT